jgi:metal-responsive CopG/Arc/MetJ family transcriptional regulator
MQNNTPSKRSKPRRRKSEESVSVRINLTISKPLLERVDQAAIQDYTNRSDIIRAALLWYLRPQGRELDQTDPKAILATLKQRDAQAKLRKMLKDID